jgi:carbon-monoxide dehydrogenase large subunit
MGGVYDIPAIALDVRGAFTNTVPIDAYRGAGKPEANYIIERLADLAARRIGITPAEIRRRNIVRSFPHRTQMGMSIEAGAFGDSLDRVLEAASAGSFAERRRESERRGMLRGLGLACFLETARGAPANGRGSSSSRMGPSPSSLERSPMVKGTKRAFRRSPPISSGSRSRASATSRRIRGACARARATAERRSLHQGGTAMVRAIEVLLGKARLIAGQLLQAAPNEITFDNGTFSAPGEGRSVSILAVAEAAQDPEQLPPGLEPALFGEVDNPLDAVTFPNGCHVAEVEIDPETGHLVLLSYIAVDDYGTLINPMLTEGQVQGGLAQGIGQAAFERVVYDEDSGQLVTASLMDYQLPRAADLPAIEVRFNPVPSAANPLGVKGSGQAGCIAAPQTVMNAVLDALAPLGIVTFDMPATPERLWRAIQAGRREVSA